MGAALREADIAMRGKGRGVARGLTEKKKERICESREKEEEEGEREREKKKIDLEPKKKKKREKKKTLLFLSRFFLQFRPFLPSQGSASGPSDSRMNDA